MGTISSRHESRQGSLSADLDGAGNLTIPSSSTVGSNLASMEKKASKKSKKKMDFVDRAKTAINLNKNSATVDEEEEDPYAWLSKTAPPSPGYVIQPKVSADTDTKLNLTLLKIEVNSDKNFN